MAGVLSGGFLIAGDERDTARGGMGGRDVAGKRIARKSTAASRLGLARILAIGILIVAAPTARTAATRPEERSRSFHLGIITSSSCFANSFFSCTRAPIQARNWVHERTCRPDSQHGDDPG